MSCSAQLGLARCLLCSCSPAGCLEEGPCRRDSHCCPDLVLLLGGGSRMRNREVRVPQKRVAGGDTCGALGTSQAGHVFGEHSLCQGPNLRGGSLWLVWRCPYPLSRWEKGKGSESVLFWSWPRKARRGLAMWG